MGKTYLIDLAEIRSFGIKFESRRTRFDYLFCTHLQKPQRKGGKMTSLMPEMSPVFQYGLLASNVSRIITMYRNEQNYTPSSDSDKGLLEQASSFVDSILTSQQLVSGCRGDMAPPSVDGLMAFQYAVSSLPKFYKQAIGKPMEREKVFKRIKGVLKDMLIEPKANIDEEELLITNSFFGVVADVYLDEIQQSFTPEPFSFPK